MPDFNVIHVASGRVLPRVYHSSRDAARVARLLTARWGVKYQPRPIKIPNWCEKELKQIKDYDWPNRLPWMKTLWYARGSFADKEYKAKRYPRMNLNKPMIDYYKTEEDGMRGKLTSITPGRYLKKYYSEDLTPHQIRDLATQYEALFGPINLKFATTADEIEWVFRNGSFGSCAHKPDWPRNGVPTEHPARIYAGGDLAIAYITKGDKVIARSICWPAKMICVGNYGDTNQIKMALLRAGYTYVEGGYHGANTQNAFAGVKLRKITYENKYVGVHIDYFPAFVDRGDYLEVSSRDDAHGFFIEAGHYAQKSVNSWADPAPVRAPNEAVAA